MSSQLFATNKILSARLLAANEVDDVKGDSGSKPVKPKTGQSESRKLSKSKKISKVGIYRNLLLEELD